MSSCKARKMACVVDNIGNLVVDISVVAARNDLSHVVTRETESQSASLSSSAKAQKTFTLSGTFYFFSAFQQAASVTVRSWYRLFDRSLRSRVYFRQVEATRLNEESKVDKR